jgi:Zn-dependent alcohol dehydrogenase
VLDQAYAATSPGGTIVCVGVPEATARPSLPGPELVRQEKIVTGSLYGSSRPALDIPAIAKLFKAKRLPLERLVTKTYDLDNINQAFDAMAAGILKRGVIILDKASAW